MITPSSSTPTSRLGFHYFPDTLHYREADLQSWLPVLRSMSVSWLVLRSELGRAVPEVFLRGLKSARVEPVIQFPLGLERVPDPKEIATLLDVYARWGTRYLVLFDRPNARASWPAAGWAQQDLVERFLDRYLPLASMARKAGMIPVFPPLEPGGSYWDTAFLQTALEAMLRRKQDGMLSDLVLSAYGWTQHRSLNWGAGGPDRWPQARPYASPRSSEDQRGFRVFDWYQAAVRAALHQTCPIMLFQAALPADPRCLPAEPTGTPQQAARYDAVTRLMDGELVSDPDCAENALEAVPPEVIASNFWLLSAAPASPYAAQTWFAEDGTPGSAAQALMNWSEARARAAAANASSTSSKPGGIGHYLLLPGYEWGVSDWYLEVIRPFVKKYRPTIGFSPDEATNAARVTVVGNSQNYPENMLGRLQKAGCLVEQISGSGIEIATKLAER